VSTLRQATWPIDRRRETDAVVLSNNDLKLNWVGSWPGEESAAIHVVLSKVPKEDRPAVTGLTLRRVKRVSDDADCVSDTSVDALVTWHDTAQFVAIDKYRSNPPSLSTVRKLVVSDVAFVGTSGTFEIAHEVGHAVLSQPFYAKQAAAYRAAYECGLVAVQFNAAATAEETCLAEELRPAEARRVKLRELYQDAKAIADDSDVAPAGRQKATEACERMSARIARYDRETLDPISARHDELVATRTRLKADLDQLARARVAAERAVESVFSEREQRPHRLINFVKKVDSSGVSPELTEYSAKNWPAKPQEFFAEAYACFLLDPDRLGKHSKELYDYFAQGFYRNDAL
jgi:hypothetical protein